ncbi:hypothetical protein A2V82_09600 [candidate division KSB1 bacterium RBG_16_48_16]|nr:MAG: hypothetical protein A2V82_09600 [candidate division KSB1 bacterium RBG_16_48_16]
MKISFRQKLIFLSLSLLVIVTAAASFITTYELQRFYKIKIFDQLKSQLYQVEFLLNDDNFTLANGELAYNRWVSYARSARFRLTFMDSSGVVLFDSNVPKDSLLFVESHLVRREMQQALASGFGKDQRISGTIHQPLFYAAKRVDTSSTRQDAIKGIHYVRVAIPLKEVEDVLNDVRWKIFGGGGISLLIIAFFSYWLSSRLTYPIHKLAKVAESINQGQLDARFDHDSEDEIGELAELLNDIMEKLQNDLVQMRKLEKMRSQFLGNVSHELRTPIFAVQGYLETLLADGDYNKKTARKFISNAYQQAVRLNNLLTDLINISRIESGEMQMSFDNFNLKKWLARVVDEMQSTAQEHDVKLVSNSDSASKKIKTLGDQARLHQVMTNLISNAIKYNVPKGTVEIGYIDLGANVEIYVKDSGRGVPDEHIPRIFERFYRVDKERSRSVGGTGLGLAIVKHIVEAHGSHIHVESVVGRGSRFSFALRKTGY